MDNGFRLLYGFRYTHDSLLLAERKENISGGIWATNSDLLDIDKLKSPIQDVRYANILQYSTD